MSIKITDEITEVGARALAMLTPNEGWPTNASLGGNATGTRDDEYRAAMHEQAHMVAAAIAPLIEAAVREQITKEEQDEPPSLTIWADGATTDQREVIYGAAVDAAFDASEGMDGVSVGAVGSLNDVRGEQR